MNQVIVEKFCSTYQKLDKNNLYQLDDIYDSNITFIDSVHQLEGIAQLKTYFTRLYQNLTFCRFDIEQAIVQQGQACIIWTMTFSNEKLKSGEAIVVNGCSHLKFDEKIYYHRDYMDMGQMIYEHLPLLGRVLKFIKQRVSQ